MGSHYLENLWISQFSSVAQSVQLFLTPWTAKRQASLSVKKSRSLLKLMSIESVMPSNNLNLCRPLLLLPSIFPRIRVFSNESVLSSGGQSIGVSALASVLPMNIQDWFPLGWTGWISLQSKGLSFLFFSFFFFYQRTFKSLSSWKHHSSKASILWYSAFL